MTLHAAGHPAPLLPALDLDGVPAESRARFYVEIAGSGIGVPLAVPVMVARGRKAGPTFGITAAVHGNELNGIPVIHRLFDRIDLSKLRGTLVGVPVVNVVGFARRTRLFVEGMDLNHIMPGRPDGNAAEVYAYRFIDRVVRKLDVLVDLHTASLGRVNSLYVRADLSRPDTARIAYRLRPQIILHNPASDGTLRAAAADLGIPAVTLEIGNPQRFHPEFVRTSVVGLRSVIADWGMLPRRKVSPGPDPVLCRRSVWLYTQQGGLLRVAPTVVDHVKKGSVLAQVTNIFNDPVEQIVAPFDGIVIGRSVDPVAQSGARVVHLGQPADSTDHFVPRSASPEGS